jgi:polyhydroxyalkanoate synthesis repressor PhaR
MTQNKDDSITIIKKYANRRLYNTGTSTYVTLEDLAKMVKSGEEFEVQDAKSGEDITHSVLTQIIFDQESKGESLLPITVLRRLISFYGDQVESLVPSYLEYTMEALVKNQERIRSNMAETFKATTLNPMQEQIKRNTDMFQKTMSFFTPHFPEDDKPSSTSSQDLAELKEQLAQMQKQLNELAKK